VNDPRFDRLAELLVHHSTTLQPGEHVLVEAFDVPREMVLALIRAARAAGAHPHVALRDTRVMRALVDGAPEAALDVWAGNDRHRMTTMQAYIALRGGANASENAGIPQEQMQRWARHYSKPVHFEQRINHTKWCVLRWPSPSMAQLAEMSTGDFEDFYFKACTMDYARMAVVAEPLAARMRAADQVHLKGPGDTDLTFSIRGIAVIPCCGDKNIPDGECFTAPVRDSVNGVIQFNTATLYNGLSFRDIRLTFEDGRIKAATAAQGGEHLAGVFDTDEGARYVGEFSLGFHPHILTPMKDILFDEKIAGSLHFTPGRAYEEADNTNRSEIHWDLVLIQRPEYGGGTVAFDGEVIRRDGLFVPEDLVALNPEHLGA